MPGVPFDSTAPTRLLRSRVAADGQFFEFGDTAFGGRPRYRSVCVDQDPLWLALWLAPLPAGGTGCGF